MDPYELGQLRSSPSTDIFCHESISQSTVSEGEDITSATANFDICKYLVGLQVEDSTNSVAPFQPTGCVAPDQG